MAFRGLDKKGSIKEELWVMAPWLILGAGYFIGIATGFIDKEAFLKELSSSGITNLLLILILTKLGFPSGGLNTLESELTEIRERMGRITGYFGIPRDLKGDGPYGDSFWEMLSESRGLSGQDDS